MSTRPLDVDPKLVHPAAPHEQADYVNAAIDHERAAGVAAASEAILAGRPGRAHFLLARSVERQARLAGIHQPISDGAA